MGGRAGIRVAAAAAAILAGVLLLRAAGRDAPSAPPLDVEGMLLGPGAGAAAPPPASVPAAPADGTDALAGIVVDGEGRPVAGAEVLAARDGDAAPARGATGADGAFRLAGLDAAGTYLLAARAPGLGPAFAGGLRPGGDPVRVVLRPPFRLEGGVKDGEGRPCPGAEVRVVLLVPGQERPLGGPRTHADEDGAFAFDGLPRLGGTVEARHGGRLAGPEPLAVRDGDARLRVDLVVRGGARLAGRAVDAGGRPLAGLRIAVEEEGARGGRFAETDRDGNWEVFGLQGRPCDVIAADPSGRHLEVRLAGILPPRSGLESVHAVDPAGPGAAAWRLVGPDGAAIPFARVAERAEAREEPAASDTASPGADGVFRRRMGAGRWRLLLRHPAGSVDTGAFEVRAGETTDLGTLRLVAGVAVTGRILDEDGAPLREGRVHVGAEGLPEAGLPDGTGRFTVEGLPADRGTLRIEAPGRDSLAVPWQGGAGATVDLGDLRPRAAAGVLRVVLRSASGAPLRGLTVRAARRDLFLRQDDAREAEVGADGVAVLRGVPAARWSLSVLAPADPGQPAERRGFRTGVAGPEVDLGPGEEREVAVDLR